MAHRPLYGHSSLRRRLATAAHAGRLPASLLFVGPRGVGKQRLALWLGQLLLCQRAVNEGLFEPCEECQHCRYASRSTHPDLHWFFPRPNLGSGATTEHVKADFAEAISERMSADGLWAPSVGSDGIYMMTMRSLLQQASVRPAMATRSLFVVGDAERMVPQESAPEAANAFLKLLEEPPASTTLILTTSEPGALLPTIRSRVVTMRVPGIGRSDMEAFLDDEAVKKRLSKIGREDAIQRAGGAPGELLADATTAASFASARKILEAALEPSTPAGTASRIKISARQGVAGARGPFSDMLDALTVLLHERATQLVMTGRDSDARRTARAVMDVELVKRHVQNNVSPNLLSASLVSALHRTLRP